MFCLSEQIALSLCRSGNEPLRIGDLPEKTPAPYFQNPRVKPRSSFAVIFDAFMLLSSLS
jgi:hypothetical protein